MKPDDIARSVKGELDKIWEKPFGERAEQLKLLRAKVKSYGIPFFNQFLDGLYEFSTLHAKRKRITKELEYSEEKRNREKLIAQAQQSQYLFNEAIKKLNSLDLPEELKSFFTIWARRSSFYSSMQVYWQQAIIYMHDGDYDKATGEAEKGLKEATDWKRERNINQFAGLKCESEAYKAFVDKRWWDIGDDDYRNAIKLFERAIDCYRLAKVSNNIICMPEALICLLRFIASPTLESLNYLVKFGEIRDRFPSVGYAFRPSRRPTSERKKQRNLIMQYLRNVTYKIAAFNIFEELRTMTVELENFAWKSDGVHQKIEEKIPEDAQLYKRKRPPSIEIFIDHCEELLGRDLPKSITLLRNIYHDCKHKKIYIDYNVEPDKLAEELVNKVLNNYEDIKDLRNDIEALKIYFTTQ